MNRINAILPSLHQQERTAATEEAFTAPSVAAVAEVRSASNIPPAPKETPA